MDTVTYITFSTNKRRRIKYVQNTATHASYILFSTNYQQIKHFFESLVA